MGSDSLRVWSAATGLVLVLFLMLHLGGVVIAPFAPASFETYAASLHHSAWLPFAEFGFLAAALIHLGLSLAKLIVNRRTGNRAGLVSRRGDRFAVLAARSQAIGGLILLGFLVVHVLQLRWPRPPAGEELIALRVLLSQPANLGLYLLSAVAVSLHLFHGGEAAHRSLGLLDPANGFRIRRAFRMLALLVGGGFSVVALLVSASALQMGQ
ncbi:succinate dehydrogenase cytochrome b subunit [Prochlorococcus marinus]|uniref:Succinate dehydrogenase n=1 Tax=Prochlorococcus marinus (strain MIT 9303) TaxID=59922 RepID=A2C613_PROM3|nr:succinate dehydrogenase cytochrome b subunit [Prochlorococcus marinus]ABM76923.1 Succinate dehydrogenase [Prochlorococcus marinus str. MIT 9303]